MNQNHGHIRRKKTWLGHTLRGRVSDNVTERAVEGRRARGRPRIGMLSDLTKEGNYKMKAMTSDSYGDC